MSENRKGRELGRGFKKGTVNFVFKTSFRENLLFKQKKNKVFKRFSPANLHIYRFFFNFSHLPQFVIGLRRRSLVLLLQPEGVFFQAMGMQTPSSLLARGGVEFDPTRPAVNTTSFWPPTQSLPAPSGMFEFWYKMSNTWKFPLKTRIFV